MNRIVSLLLVVLAAAPVACAQPPVPTAEVKAPAPVVTAAPKAGWQQKWDAILSSAQKEGSVSVYTVWPAAVRLAITQPFKTKYGIDTEFSPFTRTPDLVAKVKAEQGAGIYAVDVFGEGNSSFLNVIKPEGLLGPLEPLLVLPEVLDPKVWRVGAIPFTDKENKALSLIGAPMRSLVYNTDLIKEGEITTYRDLLKPQYKGKITLEDPSSSGPGNALFSHLGINLWGEDETVGFLRRLLKDQEVVLQRDRRVHVESVARGKYALGLAPMGVVVSEFLTLGAPVKIALVKEDTYTTASAGALGVPTRFAHPNAAVVLINWLLTKEGQSVFAPAYGNPGTRIDASTEGINPLFIPVPGEKYYAETEDYFKGRGRWLEIAKKLIAETAK